MPLGNGEGTHLSGLRAASRQARELREKLPQFVVRYLMAAFVLFFATERLVGWMLGWAPLRWYPEWWVEGLSAAVVTAAAATVLPRLPRMKAGEALAQWEHDRFLAAAESSLDDFYIFDGIADASGAIVDFRFSYINPNAERRLQTRRESLMGKILTEERPFMVSSGLIHKYREVVRTGEPFSCEVYLDDERIKATWLNVQVVKLGDGIAITSRDITERKRLDDHVHYLAHYDQLTGLPNRTLLQDRLRQALLRAQRYGHKVAVFMLDIDHFKRINDSLGHADGDVLLATVGKRLLSVVRETDTIARMGGDEFVVVMPDFTSLADVKRCGAQIVETAAQPVRIGEREIAVTVSVGLCIYPDCGLEIDELLKNADAAMYEIKDRGRNGFHMFAESMLGQ
jgi:diguanylate cyclase (GGDEF)-like protein